MDREGTEERQDFSMGKRNAKSHDLKHRLFEIGFSSSPKGSMQSQLRNRVGSPKHGLAPKHLLTALVKDNSSQLLKYQPSASPQLMKTHGKDFHIRKNIKFPFSPKAQQAPNTLSSFYRPDSVRLEQR